MTTQYGCAKRKSYYEFDDGTCFEVDSKYVPFKNIGRGAYGVVYSALNSETNENVAIKKIANAFQHSSDALQTLKEIRLLKNIKHPNVIALKDVMLPVRKSTFLDVYLVYELMDTDLNRIIRSQQSLSCDHVKYIFFQLLRGLEHLHSANILHRDLKPDNVFINKNCNLKIGDFGLATTIKGNEEDFLQEYVVTRWYRAPELLVGCNNYGNAIDIWALGCILAELLGRKPIFPGTDTLDQLTRIIKVLGSPCEDDLKFVNCAHVKKYIDNLPYFGGESFTVAYPNADELSIDLLKKLLAFHPKHRITATEALKHPYLSSAYEFDNAQNQLAKKPLDLHLKDDTLGIPKIRELIWREMRSYHRQARVAQTYKKRSRTT